MSPKHFGDVQWDKYDPYPGAGWRMPSDPSRFISADDPYWGHVLDNARNAYGDPNIHFNADRALDTEGHAQPRHLVFGDGSDLPANGTVVYHDSGNKQNWAQNDDGTSSLVSPEGYLGPPIKPSGYRKTGDHYAPVEDHGQQIAPQLAGLPNSDNGFYNDPKTGVLTPKNANGDYYTLGPDGNRAYFDKNGKPITVDQYNKPGAGPADKDKQPPAGDFATDEQQSGRAADAIKTLHDNLKGQYTKLSTAEEKLSDLLLSTHATNAEGQQKLNSIEKKLEDAINNPPTPVNTAPGTRSFLAFLRGQVSDINDVVQSGCVSAEDQTKIAQAVNALYASDDGTGGPNTPDPSNQPAPAPAPAPVPDPSPAPAPADPGGIGDDPGLGPAPQMPDPLTSMMGNPMDGMGQDPFSQLASALPGALGSLGGMGGGGSPLDGLSGLGSSLGSALSPLAGLASQGSDQGSDHNHDSSDRSDKNQDKDSKDKSDQSNQNNTNQPPTGQQNNGNQTPGQPGQPDPNAPAPGTPPAAAVPPAAPTTTVKLPDGSTSTTRDPRTAAALTDYIGGDTVQNSYGKHGMTLPPPGTPLTNPLPPTKVTGGDVAVFMDHYEPVLSAVKALHNGQVVPLSSVTNSPGFLGFIDPTAAAAAPAPTGAAPAAAAAPAPVAAPAGAPAPAPAAPISVPAG
ncbi:DUF4226 domain-containing protein [Mycobacterium sp. CBMA293]|uniref:Biofilm regulator BssS n=2 Tax=unclassified Mycolicibacterium TaxID=2636767 RepID=A0A1S6GKR6_9MYCO|nr:MULTISPECIES: DUF4226 domain-containing protein [unclassified Mycolicibacterium]AQS22433.1 Biofilm regulator BssS [Mycolicibacterium sp. CBMA 213]MUL48336.1 DUF4226 domain-containing protein [Mycolicibacterium sp. CBMA 360]MUL62347.1 DUF4226 domain-containing protein [Mycolicibacterium sp. CBMA 335]MUM04484.1 hypothetical protein [Mycolicibacterium sp. CBMA 213]MUM14747.1 DUF4226 domain-containing protein [Mycolicibacterium sp. CBMA 293]